MECNFVVGQKVVLVDDSTRGGPGRVSREEGIRFGAQFPVKGKIYTIREIYVSVCGKVALTLHEIDNRAACKRLGKLREIGFDADRFRAAITRETDISVFKAMLNPSKVREPANV